MPSSKPVLRRAAAHARRTLRVFGLPTEVQLYRIARDWAALNQADEAAVLSAMLEVFAAAEAA